MIGNDHGEFAIHRQMQGFLATRSGHGMIASPRDKIIKDFEDDRVVVDRQNGVRGFVHGSGVSLGIEIMQRKKHHHIRGVRSLAFGE